MSKQLLKQIDEVTELYRDTNTGIAWVENGHTGSGHSAHPNIDVSGSVSGMKKLGYWGQKDRIVRSHGFYYNIDRVVITDDLDKVAAEHCRCGGKH